MIRATGHTPGGVIPAATLPPAAAPSSTTVFLKDLVEVALDIPSRRGYNYRVPEALQGRVQAGSMVLVPMGRRDVTGVVLGPGVAIPGVSMKLVSELLDDHPVLRADQIALARWISDYYLTPIGSTVRAMLPRGIDRQSIRVASLTPDAGTPERLELLRSLPDESQVLDMLRKMRNVPISRILRRLGEVEGRRALRALEKNSLIMTRQILLPPRIKPRTREIISPTDPGPDRHSRALLERRAPQQFRILRYLDNYSNGVPRTQLLKETNVGPSALTGLVRKGFVVVRTEEVERTYPLDYNPEYRKPTALTEDQDRAVRQINATLQAHRFVTFLLHGVTGSGKTQVYIEAVQQVLARGQSALLLVPEISLTSQAVSRLRGYFADSVAFVHSQMHDGERYDVWRRIRTGERRVVIGPRSAIFAPLQDLGIIIVDEEHDDSYKQQDLAPRYHARDVAVMRGRHSGCPVILGSATPSIEARHNVDTGKFTLLHLPRRIDNIPLPKVHVIDMLREPRQDRVLSRMLADSIRERILQGEQVIVLRNRRGFSSFVQCRDCGFVMQCEHCDITLTYHKFEQRLRCHYCGHTDVVPGCCRKCRSERLRYGGIGTQQVEEEVQALDPAIRVIRMDADTTTRRGAHGKLITAFERGDYNVLLGTQMIAKGFDFPNVNLVGVVSAESSLLLPDFRAAERTFQLLTQLAGRAGRRKIQGTVIIQTNMPEHYSILCAVQHDSNGFVAIEKVSRRELCYPPFGRFVLVRFSGESEPQVRKAAVECHKRLSRAGKTYHLYDPSPAVIARIKKRHRWQILLKTAPAQAHEMRVRADAAVRAFMKSTRSKSVSVSIDVDPVSLM